MLQEVYTVSNFYNELDDNFVPRAPQKQLIFEKTVFEQICHLIRDKESSFKDLKTSILLGDINISPSCIITVTIESYSPYERSESTSLNSLEKKVSLQYKFPTLDESNFIHPKQARRKQLSVRNKLMQNFLHYSFVKLDLNGLLKFGKYLATL